LESTCTGKDIPEYFVANIDRLRPYRGGVPIPSAPAGARPRAGAGAGGGAGEAAASAIVVGGDDEPKPWYEDDAPSTMLEMDEPDIEPVGEAERGVGTMMSRLVLPPSRIEGPIGPRSAGTNDAAPSAVGAAAPIVVASDDEKKDEAEKDDIGPSFSSRKVKVVKKSEREARAGGAPQASERSVRASTRAVRLAHPLSARVAAPLEDEDEEDDDDDGEDTSGLDGKHNDEDGEGDVDDEDRPEASFVRRANRRTEAGNAREVKKIERMGVEARQSSAHYRSGRYIHLLTDSMERDHVWWYVFVNHK
jgi:hypothetical protein